MPYHYTPFINFIKMPENHFIDHFISKPFSFFNGLVPLFVQFVDIHCYDFLEAKDKNASIPS